MNFTHLRALAALTLAGLSAGCVLLQPNGGPAKPPAPVVEPLSEPDLGALLRYYRELQAMPEKALDLERQQLAAPLTANRCDLARLKFALVILRTSVVNPKQDVAEDVLKPCVTDPALINTNLLAFAQFVHAQLREAASNQTRLRAANQEIEQVKKENGELKRQLDGLKAIERSLQDRRRR